MFSAGDTETVVVARPPGKDNFGDRVAGSSEETELAGCLFAPAGSSEDNVNAAQVNTDATLYAPAGADIVATDRVVARDVSYEVVGEIQQWATTGVVVQLRRTTG